MVVGEVMETLAVDGEEYKRFIQFRQLTDCTGFFFRHFVGSKICDDEEKNVYYGCCIWNTNIRFFIYRLNSLFFLKKFLACYLI